MADVTEVIHKISYEVNDTALIKQYEQIVKLSNELNKMGAAGGAATKTMSKFGGVFKKAFGKAGWVGLAMQATDVMKDFVLECTKAALAAEDTRIAFDKNFTPELLDNLRTATKGVVTDVELMKAALTTKNLDLPVEQLANAMRYAHAKSRETGESVEELTRKILIGLGTKSDKTLRELGLDVRKINAEFAETGDYVTAASNAINRELEISGANISTYGERINYLGVLWDNFKVKAGNALLEVGNEIAKSYLMSNPFTAQKGIEFEIQDRQRELYEKRLQMKHDYIKKYNEADAQGRSVLLNDVTNWYLKLEKAEATARKNNLKAAADDFAQQMRLIDEFYNETYFKNVNKTGDDPDDKPKPPLVPKTAEEKYAEEQHQLDVIAAKQKNLDIVLRDMIKARIEAEKEYRVLLETDIKEGRIISAEEREQREKDYNEQIRIIQLNENLRINELLQQSIERKLNIARAAKNELDVARLESELLQNQLKREKLNKEGAQIRAARADHLDRMPFSGELKSERKFEEIEVPNTEIDTATRLEKILEKLDLANSLTEEQKENINSTIEEYNKLAEAAVNAYNTILEAQISALDKEIALREKRVEAATRLAEKGNVEALRIEEQRLREAQEQREKIAKRQLAVNAALTISNSIGAVAKAAIDGDSYSAAVRIALIVAALTAAVAQVSALAQDSAPSFADGVVGFKGKGGPRDDSNWVRISSGESVITAEGTRRNYELLEAINEGGQFVNAAGALPFMMPAFKSPQTVNNYAAAQDLRKVEHKLDNVVNAIEGNRMRQNIFFDEQGVGIMTERAASRNRKRWM